LFDWIGEVISGAFEGMTGSVSSVIFDLLLKWIYSAIYDAIAQFFGKMSAMGAEIFLLPWVEAVQRLFYRFGWALFTVGMVVAIFDVAIESQSGRASPKTAALNIMKGFLAAAMFCYVPIELYKFCVTLQNKFLGDVGQLIAGAHTSGLGMQGMSVFEGAFKVTADLNATLFSTLSMIAFAYAVVKVFFSNLKRGGILLTQIAVGLLYLFSVPRGYSDGFWSWAKQVAALCLTAFLQTTLLFLGLLTFPDHQLLGLGIMLSAGEVPRIAQQFGLDTSARLNLSSVVHMSSTAIGMIRTISK
jgi:anti-anti-sigma regulatory factor